MKIIPRWLNAAEINQIIYKNLFVLEWPQKHMVLKLFIKFL